MSRKVSNFFRAGKEPAPRGEVSDCVLCQWPTVFPQGTPPDDRLCGWCQARIDNALRDIEAIPDPPGQRSDPDLCAALGMSIIANVMDAEREREYDEAAEGGRR